jgi:hypothetical protein
MTTTDLPATSVDPAPRRRVGPWLVVGVLFALVLLVNGVLIAASVFARNSETRAIDVSAAGIESIVIEGDSGAIDVTGSTGSDITGYARLEWSFNKPDVDTRVDGDTLVVQARCTGWQPGWGCQVHLDLAVPRDAALDIRSDSGTIRADGFDAGVTLHTDSGAVFVSEVVGGATVGSDSGRINLDDIAGQVVASTDSGGILGSGLDSPSVEASSDSGPVDVSLIRSPTTVTAQTDSGDVTVEVPDARGVAYVVQTSTDSGREEVEVRTDPDSERLIEAVTDSGNVHVRYR